MPADEVSASLGGVRAAEGAADWPVRRNRATGDDGRHGRVTERYTLSGEEVGLPFADVGGETGVVECGVCWALVRRELMAFHRQWHASLDGGGPRVFETSEPGAVDEKDDEILKTIALLQAVPRAEPRPEFVDELRKRLVAEARRPSQGERSSSGSGSSLVSVLSPVGPTVSRPSRA